jgi:hypothetical protein
MSFSVKKNTRLVIASPSNPPNYWSVDSSSNIFNNNSSGFVGINKTNITTPLDISGTTTININAATSDALVINKITDRTNITKSQITFTENGTTNNKAVIWYESDQSGNSRPGFLRLGSGNPITSWTIQPIASTGSRAVDKLSYGEVSGSLQDLVCISYKNDISIGDPNIVNLLNIRNNGVKRLTLDISGNLSGVAGTTSMTNGFFYISAAAGAPSAAPPSIITGSVPMYYDTTNNRFNIYNGGWRYVNINNT